MGSEQQIKEIITSSWISDKLTDKVIVDKLT